MSKEDLNFFLQERFKKEASCIKNAISNLSIGNYTKNYETWKRAENIIRCFKEEIIKKQGIVKVVDIGCADGLYIFWLNSIPGLRNKVYFYGIDLSPSEIYFAEEMKKFLGADNVTFEIGNAENLKLPSLSFDIVICAEVIEHLANPKGCLGEIKRVLKPGGIAIITTPNKDNSILKLKKILKDKKSNSYPEIEKGFKLSSEHISVKGLAEWKRIMQGLGFKIEDIRRGSLLWGGPKYDAHPLLFSVILILDRILDYLPVTLNLTENITFKLRKPYSHSALSTK